MTAGFVAPPLTSCLWIVCLGVHPTHRWAAQPEGAGDVQVPVRPPMPAPPGQSAGPHPDSAMALGGSPGPSSAGEEEGHGPACLQRRSPCCRSPGWPQPFFPMSGPRGPLRTTQGRREVPGKGWSRPLCHRAGMEGLGLAHPPPSSQGAGRASWGRVPGAASEAFSVTLVWVAVSGKNLFPTSPPSASW